MARAFVHPAVNDLTIDGVLYALSDPARREILAKLGSGEGMSCNKAACEGMSPSTVSFHHKILRESGLIKSEKIGVEVVSAIRFDDVNSRFPGLLESVMKFHKNAQKNNRKKSK